MKKITAGKNILTLLSVLSVLLVFSLVCMLCLFAMDKLGIVSLSGPVPDETQDPSVETEFPLPVHTSNEQQAAALEGGVSVFERIFADIPYGDSYYIKMSVSVDETAEGAVPVSGTYEIWRFADKYKIHRYNSENETEWIVTCDGVRLQVIDFTEPSNTYYSVSDGYTFEKIAPLPDFGALADTECEIFEYSETGDVCSAAIEYPSISTVDNVVFSKSTGMLDSFSRFRGGRLIWKIDVESVDLDFLFSDYMFQID